MTTTAKLKEEPMTFEQIRELFQEIGRKQEETDRQMKEMSREADLRRKEADDQRRMEAEQQRVEAEQRRKDEEQRKKEADLQTKDLKQTVKDVSRQLGGMANSDGDAAEEHFATSLASKMTFAGQHYDAIDYKVKRTVKGLRGEFDIVLYNGAAVAIIEVKNKACKADVEELVAKKLPDFRTLFPLYKNHTVYLGIGSMSFADDRVLKKARELGIGILRQKGDTIENDTDYVRAY